MNKEWSDLNKQMQTELRKESSFASGISTLIELRYRLFNTIKSFFETLSNEEFSAMPYLNATGYHNKTVAYSIWHIFRIEDIVLHSLIKSEDQVFFAGHYDIKIQSNLITTGNELVKTQIADFSQKLDLKELFRYALEVKKDTDAFLRNLTHHDLKRVFSQQDKQYLRSLRVVDESPQSVWLIDYWCDKNLEGLIKMPFSRHWIMHVEAALRIIRKLN